ncbi:MAG: tetratricopeptide repeat protein, partial [Alphaproteobacteria bacterium]|nr:tetratricopeptide repeat protein [Alphaproteobacteria bacterium]
LLATGREAEGLAALRKLIDANDGRAYRVQLAAAARLSRGPDRLRALDWLQGDAEPLVDARQRLQQGKPLSGAIDTAPEGLAEFLLAMAIDLRRQEVTPLALSFSRLSTFLAPGDSEAWLVVSALLAAQNQNESALAALRRVGPTDPLAGAAADARIRLLTASGEQAAALQQAEKAAHGKAAGASDWIRLGDLYDELGRHQEAAEAYASARGARQDSSATPEWSLWLLRGGSLLRAGNWRDGKASLEAAYKLAPDQPLVLNYLGYAQLERRENIPEAEKLIRKANRLDPDSPQITDSLGWARYLQGDVANAIALLETAVLGEPTDAAINEHLGDAYFSAGRRYEARYAWSAALVSAERKDAERLRAKLETGLAPNLAAP